MSFEESRHQNIQTSSQIKKYQSQKGPNKNISDYLPSQIFIDETNIKCLNHHVATSNQQLFLCLQKKCNIFKNENKNAEFGKNGMQFRVICSQCINEQTHKGHYICSISKYKQIAQTYQKQSKDVLNLILSKIEQLKYRFQKSIAEFSERTKKIFQFSQPNCSEQQIKPHDKKPERVTLQQLKHIIRSSNISQSINSMLKFQQESISQQIQNIYNNVEQSINDGIANMEFINRHHHLTFNPGDMHSDSIGLTLDRNKLQVIDSQKKVLNQGQQPTKLLKLAFAQCRLFTDNSFSFRINSIKDKVMIGCVDRITHQQIAKDLQYENCQDLIYGISIDSEGHVTLFNKGLEPTKLQATTQVYQNDIIELTFHHRQSTITIIKYSAAIGMNNRTDLSSLIQNNIQIVANIDRKVIATISIQPPEQNYIYPFAAARSQGDSISIIESITLESNQIDSRARKVNDSFTKQKQEVQESSPQFKPILKQKLKAFKQKQKNKKNEQTKY